MYIICLDSFPKFQNFTRLTWNIGFSPVSPQIRIRLEPITNEVIEINHSIALTKSIPVFANNLKIETPKRNYDYFQFSHWVILILVGWLTATRLYKLSALKQTVLGNWMLIWILTLALTGAIMNRDAKLGITTEKRSMFNFDDGNTLSFAS